MKIKYNKQTAQRRNGATAQRRNGATAQRRNGATAQQRNSATAQQRNSATAHRRITLSDYIHQVGSLSALHFSSLYIFLLFLFFFTHIIYAIPLDNGVYKISQWAPNTHISNVFIHVENKARTQDMIGAENILSSLLSNTNTYSIITNTMTPDGPLDVVIDAVRIDYLSKAKQDKAFIDFCENIIDSHAERAKDKNWNAYKQLFHRVLNYYGNLHDYDSLYQTHLKMIQYDPHDYRRILILMHDICEHNPRYSFITNVWYTYKRYVPESGQKAYYSAKVASLTGSLSLSNFVHLVTHYTPENIDQLKEWLALGRMALRSDNTKTIQLYLDALSTLALHVPADDSSIEMIAIIMAEKQKIEMLMPAITNRISHSIQ